LNWPGAHKAPPWAVGFFVGLRRRLGEMIWEMQERGELARQEDGKVSHDVTLTLPDLSITRKQSSRWKVEASVPDVEFERYVAQVRATSAAEVEGRGSTSRRWRRQGLPTAHSQTMPGWRGRSNCHDVVTT